MERPEHAIPRMASELDIGTFGIVQQPKPEPTGWVTKVGNQELWVLWKYGDPTGWQEPGGGFNPANLMYDFMGPQPIHTIEEMCNWVATTFKKPPHELTAYVHTVDGPYSPCPTDVLESK